MEGGKVKWKGKYGIDRELWKGRCRMKNMSFLLCEAMLLGWFYVQGISKRVWLVQVLELQLNGETNALPKCQNS